MRRCLIGIALVAAASAVPAGAAQAEWSVASTVPGSKPAVTNRVALSPDGTIAVAWGGSSVALKLPSGRWRSWQTIATRGTSTASIDIEFDRRGQLLATWTQSPTAPGKPLRGPYETRARTWSPRGGWGGVRVLGRAGHYQLADPRIALNPKGDAIVYWRGFRRSSTGRVVEALASSFRPAGGHFGSERRAPGGGPYRDVELDIRGNAYGVFTTYAGPRNYFVYQRRGSGWGRPELLPGKPASNPTIAVAGDRTTVFAWREAQVDSEGNGPGFGPVWALLRTQLGSFALPATRLSSTRAHEVGVVTGGDGGFLLTWAEPDFLADPPAGGDLHFSGRGEGNYLTPEHVAPALKMGPSAYLGRPVERPLLVYSAQNEIRSVLLNPPGPFFDPPERITFGGLYPSLAVRGARAVVAWYDNRRLRLKVKTRG